MADPDARGSSRRPPGAPVHPVVPGSDVVPFAFRFAPAYLAAGVPFGIGPHTARVTVSATGLAVRFGPWRVSTLLANVEESTATGPYRFHRTAGPARYSAADGGLTFATNGGPGLCLRFAAPVPGLEPTRTLRHPTLTVTVADVDGLRRLLDIRAGRSAAVPLHPAREELGGGGSGARSRS